MEIELYVPIGRDGKQLGTEERTASSLRAPSEDLRGAKPRETGESTAQSLRPPNGDQRRATQQQINVAQDNLWPPPLDRDLAQRNAGSCRIVEIAPCSLGPPRGCPCLGNGFSLRRTRGRTGGGARTDFMNPSRNPGRGW